MASGKRFKGSFDDDEGFGRSSSSKRVRFNDTRRSEQSPTDFEIDHEDVLEPARQRRGGVRTDYGSDEEEVGGGVYSSGSDSENEAKEEEPPKANAEFDMFSAPAAAPAAEATKKGKKRLELNEIEGQEFDSQNRDTDDDASEDEEGNKKEPKLTAFNMREEMEEGSFDASGNFIRNKADPQAFHDRWMEGISKKDMVRAREAQERREQAEALKEASRQAEMPQTKTDVFRMLAEYMLPGETVRETLMKLGTGVPKKVPAWKQKLLDKKKKKSTVPAAAQEQPLTEEETEQRKQSVEMVTGLADQMMALGHFTIYEDTFETIVRQLRREGAVPDDWVPTSSRRPATAPQ
ncbi:uncharacterized protein BYT42DRAFT_604919 [Radiomyces spectabilis]|uniref:uncharacterized protein n=1 Tax=Radiomyces spectabilis TaxID=64574 RepID=UPI002220F95C|nr:uncharacterized protein BYT42DRAFT_604919 [Radiomyces spectabilis]KAI8379585.1 hypothetical protein BYT42DRAFT_604919 [Radiomyces spectabilis]